MAGKYIDFDAALAEAAERPVVVRYLGRKSLSRGAAAGCGHDRRLCFWRGNVHRESTFVP